MKFLYFLNNLCIQFGCLLLLGIMAIVGIIFIALCYIGASLFIVPIFLLDMIKTSWNKAYKND